VEGSITEKHTAAVCEDTSKPLHGRCDGSQQREFGIGRTASAATSARTTSPFSCAAGCASSRDRRHDDSKTRHACTRNERERNPGGYRPSEATAQTLALETREIDHGHDREGLVLDAGGDAAGDPLPARQCKEHALANVRSARVPAASPRRAPTARVSLHLLRRTAPGRCTCTRARDLQVWGGRGVGEGAGAHVRAK